MRAISALLVVLAACGGGAVCGGCSDDAGPVDTLPESFTLVGIAGTGSASEPGCDRFVADDFVMNVRNLTTACTCYTDDVGRGDCSIAGDVITCSIPTLPGDGSWTIDVSGDVVAVSLAFAGGCTASIMTTIGPAPL
jgi:hypothetical protein